MCHVVQDIHLSPVQNRHTYFSPSNYSAGAINAGD